MAKRGRKKKITNTDAKGKEYSIGTSVGKYIGDCKGKRCGLMLGEKDTHCPRCGLVIQQLGQVSTKRRPRGGPLMVEVKPTLYYLFSLTSPK